MQGEQTTQPGMGISQQAVEQTPASSQGAAPVQAGTGAAQTPAQFQPPEDIKPNFVQDDAPPGAQPRGGNGNGGAQAQQDAEDQIPEGLDMASYFADQGKWLRRLREYARGDQEALIQEHLSRISRESQQAQMVTRERARFEGQVLEANQALRPLFPYFFAAARDAVVAEYGDKVAADKNSAILIARRMEKMARDAGWTVPGGNGAAATAVAGTEAARSKDSSAAQGGGSTPMDVVRQLSKL